MSAARTSIFKVNILEAIELQNLINQVVLLNKASLDKCFEILVSLYDYANSGKDRPVKKYAIHQLNSIKYKLETKKGDSNLRIAYNRLVRAREPRISP